MEKSDTNALFLFYANNEPKSVLARDPGGCRDNLRNRIINNIQKQVGENCQKKWLCT